jgi:hypothetical protein
MLVGRRVIGLRRILYLGPDGVRNDEDGALEISTDDGASVVLDGSADGSSLRWTTGRWLDPFAEPLSDENRRFVESSGKWVAVDVAEWDGYDRLIGQPISAVVPITPRWARIDSAGWLPSDLDRVVGVHVVTVNGGLEAFSNGGDEFHVIIRD